MTKSTDTKNIKQIVRVLLVRHGVVDANGEPVLQAEIDFVSAFLRYMFEREQGETPAQARERIMKDFGELGFIGASQEAQERARMTQVLMDVLGLDVDEGNADWAAVISFCLEKERAGETVKQFREWMNGDPFNSPKKHQIAQSPLIIKKTWRSAFEKKTDELPPVYNAIPERVGVPRPAHIPPPNIKRSKDDTADS